MGFMYDGHTSSLAADGANASWAPEIVDVGIPGETAEEISTSHLGTTSNMTKIAGALKNSEDITLTVHYDPEDLPVIGAANETWTITFPQLTGQTAPATIAFSGFAKSIGPGTLASNAKVESSVVLTISGDLMVTPATTA